MSIRVNETLHILIIRINYDELILIKTIFVQQEYTQYVKRCEHYRPLKKILNKVYLRF